eukprot:scaffold8140_cov134-Isochrysis_galbana.AAC.4
MPRCVSALDPWPEHAAHARACWADSGLAQPTAETYQSTADRPQDHTLSPAHGRRVRPFVCVRVPARVCT